MKPWPAGRTLWLWLAGSALVFLASWGAPIASGAGGNAWLEGPALRQALERPVALCWSNIPLRQAMASLSKSQRVAIVLDRRIDPDQKLELVLEDVSLKETLEKIAARCSGQVAVLESAVYIGPRAVAERIRTVASLRADEIAGLPQKMRPLWLRREALAWEALAEPRELISRAAGQSGLQLANPELVEHDLWAAGELPPMTLSRRLTLLLAQFDLTYELDPVTRTIRLIPLPDNPTRERTYALPRGSGDVVARLRQSGLSATAQIEMHGDKLAVRGRQEDHDAVQRLLAGPDAPRKPAKPREVYTLRVTMPVGKLLEQLGSRLNLAVRIDRQAIEAAGLSLEREITLDVKEVSADQLLEAVAEPAGLRLERREDAIVVLPKK